MSNRSAAALLSVFGAFVWTNAAVTAGEAPTSSQVSPLPWQQDQALLKRAEAAVRNGGILAIQSHASEIESALSNAQLTFALGDTIYVLVDGPTESIIAMATVSASKDAQGKTGVAVDNPYPMMALYLGSYYDETGKPAEALRVLNLGLSTSSVSGMELGQHRPELLIERGMALTGIKQWNDALADFDEGLKIEDLEPKVRAHLYRGRGFTLTEMRRLDEAEEAYNASLRLEPGNRTAEHEIGYIKGLRQGAVPSAGALKPVQPNSSASDSSK